MFFSFVAEIMAAIKSHCASMIVGPLERAVGAEDVLAGGAVEVIQEATRAGSGVGRWREGGMEEVKRRGKEGEQHQGKKARRAYHAVYSM